ncbi:MAG: peptide MFS transporter [Planctomycetota bacterium]|nr:peptide MFS transporter [Planctomycetota bacterium]
MSGDTTASNDVYNVNPQDYPQLFGHPTGLYTLFFAEMWERFSYYGMRALLLFYMIKQLGFGDGDAYAIYGAYTALVYMTPFFGGMIADKLLGGRTAVVIGGLLMAAGHLLMAIETEWIFFTALSLLIAGNGFFKPNISTIVGSLYPPGSSKRDGGFTIFYIGINLGAAMAPLLCGYIGETYGWHLGFGLATIGMLVGLAVFVAPTIVTQVLILGTALLSAFGLIWYNPGDVFTFWTNAAVALALVVAGVVAVLALAKGGLPNEVGRTPKPETYSGNLTKVLVITALIIPILVLLVSGGSVVPGIDEMQTLIPESVIKPMEDSESKLVAGLAEFVKEASRPAGLVLIVAGLFASLFLIREAFKMDKVGRERMYVVFILTFFSLMFWAFFEQSGSSLNNFTDRNVDRVMETSTASQVDNGKTVQLRLVPETSDDSLKGLDFLSQEYLGQVNSHPALKDKLAKAVTAVEMGKEEAKRPSPEELQQKIKDVQDQKKFTMSGLTYLREFAKREDATAEDKSINWTYTIPENAESAGSLGLGGVEIPASVFQSINPIFIMIFGLVFTALWSIMATIGMEPSTPVKFALGLAQLGLAFLCPWIGAEYYADANGMVPVIWIVLTYLFMTTGELCLSPVGLSMITKLSPARLVSTVMGAWFLATAFSQFLAAIIAQFTKVNDGGNVIPPPSETVDIYSGVFGGIGWLAIGAGVVCLVLSPLLTRWMHQDKPSVE